MTVWFTVTQAAAHIRAKHPRMIRDAIERGDLRAFVYGKSAIRIDKADLDEWLHARTWEPRAK